MTYIPDRLTLTAWKGGTFRQRFTLYNGKIGTPPRDLTGYSAILVIEDTSHNSLYNATTTSGNLTLGGTAGTIDAFISAADTRSFTFTKALYKLSVTGPNNGDTDVLLYGDFVVKDDNS